MPRSFLHPEDDDDGQRRGHDLESGGGEKDLLMIRLSILAAALFTLILSYWYGFTQHLSGTEQIFVSCTMLWCFISLSWCVYDLNENPPRLALPMP